MINPRVINQAAIIIGDFFRQRRNDLGLTINDIAEISGINKGNISGFENGNRHPSFPVLMRLCHAYRLNPHFVPKEDSNYIEQVKSTEPPINPN